MSGIRQRFSRYLPVNAEALRWEIWCNDAGFSRIAPHTAYPPAPGEHPSSHAATVTSGRVLNEFQVVYITKGSGWFLSQATGRIDVTAGDAFLLFPGVRHSYSPHEHSGWHEYWVGFAGAHAERLASNGLFSQQYPVHRVGLQEELVADYERIVSLCREQSPGFQVRLGALVLKLLAELYAGTIVGRTGSGAAATVEAARAIMHEHLDDGLTVDAIARRVGVGYARLLEIFREYTGLTPYQYYLQMRAAHAQELLRVPGTSVKAVAARMNFENQYYFSRFFKHKTGMPPSQWIAAGGAR